jgi:probable phosphoglycerate mutase
VRPNTGARPLVPPRRPLVFARHGHSLANATGMIDTALPGAELADIGRAEAKTLAVELGTPDSPVRKAAGGPVIDIVHSAAHRARDTARIVGAEMGMPVRQVLGIHEVQAGGLEGRDDDEGMELYRSVMRRWYDGELDVPMPGMGQSAGETGAEVIARYTGALNYVLEAAADKPAEPLLVVSHAAAIRFIAFTLAHNIEPDFIKANPLANCATVVLMPDGVPDGGGWRCAKWHEIDFPVDGP